MQRRLLLASMMTVSFFLAGCSHPDVGTHEPPADNGGTGMNGDTVTISGSTFRPDVLEVAPGTTVIWTNEDDGAHTATADDESWDAGTLEPGRSDGHTFSDEGEYPYHCIIHPGMTGTITVSR